MALLDYISADERTALSAPSTAWAIAVSAGNFVLVALGFAQPILWPHPLGWVLGSLMLGGRALALGVLVHETVHLSFFRSRQANEWAGRWLFGGLSLVPFAAYRRVHLNHHRLGGTAQDPDLPLVKGYPADSASLARKLARDLSGLNGLKLIRQQLSAPAWPAQLPYLVAHLVVFALLLAAGHPQVYACWWLGYLFVFPFVRRLRLMGEHGAVPNHLSEDPRENTATTLAGPIARLLVCPNWVNFHVEHHLAAGVPCYRLARLHALLRARGYFDQASCVLPSYGAVIRRCLRPAAPTARPID